MSPAVCLFLFTVASTVGVVSSLAQTVTCEMPPVQYGETAKLTCHFQEDMQRTRSTLLVKRYLGDSTEPKLVLDCYWPDNGNKYKCEVHDNFTFDSQISDQLTVELPNAGEDAEGRYICEKAGYSDDPKDCQFSLETLATQTETSVNRTTDNPKDPKDVSRVAVILGATLVCLVASIAGVLLIIFRKRIWSK